ncbi:MAG: glucuronate isomerase [Clostridia bacterium]|nr:glucuronate isomerase [Clostridia bacterium]
MSIIKDNFMLKNKTAEELYEHVKDLPIIDYHCHISPKMIAENYQFKNAFELFLGGDHYKWRQMRTNGIEERYITGDADDFEKWMAFAKTMPLLIGNPLYHWTHLELKRYFDIDECLNENTAKAIWDRVNECLAKDEYRVQGLIKMSNVETICTTDAPYDTLEYHRAIKAVEGFDTKVIPAFRPDLGKINSDFPERLDFFHENGCRLSDHAVDSMDDETIEKLIYLGEEYAKRGWVWQLHIGALRNNNTRMFKQLGPDTGFDSVNDFQIAEGLSKILDGLDKKDMLPKTILYTLNPKDNYVLGTMLGNFQGGGVAGKIQFGSGWWFNDQRDGMESQMRALANLGMIARFVGMLTDSRSFVSYTRHEYFRRIMCNLLGKWVEDGEYPADMETLKKIAADISYYNAKNYFGF